MRRGIGQLARFIEERCPELEDSLVTAVAHGASEPQPDVCGSRRGCRPPGATSGSRTAIISRRTVRAGGAARSSPHPSRLPSLALFGSAVAQAAKVVRVYLVSGEPRSAGGAGRCQSSCGRVAARRRHAFRATTSSSQCCAWAADDEWRETPNGEDLVEGLLSRVGPRRAGLPLRGDRRRRVVARIRA